jgi:hypothetical protein
VKRRLYLTSLLVEWGTAGKSHNVIKNQYLYINEKTHKDITAYSVIAGAVVSALVSQLRRRSFFTRL